jgi:hypothetical protein
MATSYVRLSVPASWISYDVPGVGCHHPLLLLLLLLAVLLLLLLLLELATRQPAAITTASRDDASMGTKSCISPTDEEIGETGAVNGELKNDRRPEELSDEAARSARAK